MIILSKQIDKLLKLLNCIIITTLRQNNSIFGICCDRPRPKWYTTPWSNGTLTTSCVRHI